MKPWKELSEEECHEALDDIARQTTELARRLAVQRGAKDIDYITMAVLFGAVVKLAGDHPRLHPGFREMVTELCRKGMHMVVIDPSEMIDGTGEAPDV